MTSTFAFRFPPLRATWPQGRIKPKGIFFSQFISVFTNRVAKHLGPADTRVLVGAQNDLLTLDEDVKGIAEACQLDERFWNPNAVRFSDSDEFGFHAPIISYRDGIHRKREREAVVHAAS